MHLSQDESRVQDYLDDRLAPEQARAVEAHLSACAECRQFFQQWHQLDLELASHLGPATLSPEFRTRLWQRIDRDEYSAAGLTADQLRLKTESDLQWRARRQAFFRACFPAFLDGLAYGTAAAVGAYFLVHFLAGLWKSHSGSWHYTPYEMTVLVASVAGLLSLLAGLGFVSRARLAYWLERW